VTKTGKICIGISGWRYPPWRGVFYPEGLPQARELSYAAGQFSTIEINGTFYSLQRPEYFARWAADTPPDFTFSVKGPRFITHMRKLRAVEIPLANFLASGVLGLGRKLGPILWQFPPNFRFEAERIEAFFNLLPHDTEAAVTIARQHDRRLTGRALTETDRKRRLRHAVEIRHSSFASPKFIALLRRHRVGLVCADAVEWPLLMDLTADFVYCRLHGSDVLYASGYDGKALRAWSRRVAAWAAGLEPEDANRVIAKPARKRSSRDVYLYFDNDAKVRAPFDALSLIRRVRRLRQLEP
jgi:uncharacterized protein YecE (DUF72 family)